MSLKILALDTSTEACSTALLYNHEYIGRYQVAPRQHTQLILPMIQALLAEADLRLEQLDAIAFGRGPGSFTGVRLAASVTQGIAYAADLPVISVSTLQALAQGAYLDTLNETVIAAIDARMNEIYWGFFKRDAESKLMQAFTPEVVCPPTEVKCVDVSNIIGVGSGWDSYHAILQEKTGTELLNWLPQRYPKANDIAFIAKYLYAQNQTLSAEQALPVYLRDKVVGK